MSFLEKLDKEKVQKVLLIVIAALVLAALVSLVVIIITSLAPMSPVNTNFELEDLVLKEGDIGQGSLLLADANHPFVPGAAFVSTMTNCQWYRNQNRGDAEKGPYYTVNNAQLSLIAIEDAHKFLVAAENAVKGDDLLIKYSYNATDGATLEYSTGMLMFLTNYDEEELPKSYADWMDKNAASYGFVESFNDAYRYVGIPHAKHMSDKGLTLAKYIEYLKKNTDSSKALNVKVDGTTYAVYYAKGVSGDTIKVPVTEEYTISGTNEGGVIVTVKLGK